MLYVLPVVFFVICYFLMVVSGEDIYQGAHSQPNVIHDAIAAYFHSARLADMYAWAVINFFDYTYQFGVDTIFRVVDVILAVGVFYLTTYLALGRRPRLTLQDAVVFAGVFLMVFLTSNGATLYGGFSKIHNYLWIGISATGFLLIYLKDVLGQGLPKKLWFSFVMLVFGFIFGMTSSVTAVAFLLGLLFYVIYLRISKQKIRMKALVWSWRGAGMLGVIISLVVVYVFGPGLADYNTSEVYRLACDYLPINELFVDVFDSIKRIFLHNAFNFGRFFAPFAVVTVPVFGYALYLWRNGKMSWPKFAVRERNFLVAILLFVVMHILVMSQIYYFTRMMLPAYLVAVAGYIYVVRRVFEGVKGGARLEVLGAGMVAAMMVIVGIRGYFAVEYYARVQLILDEIEKTEEESLCVELERSKSKNLPYVYLGQEDFLVDWAMPQTIYGRVVEYCKK